MVITAGPLPCALSGGNGSWVGSDVGGLPARRTDHGGDDGAEAVEHCGQDRQLGRPVGHPLVGWSTGRVQHGRRQFVVERNRLGEEAVLWQVIDQVEQMPPPSPLPQLDQADAFFGEVRFDGLAVPFTERSEATPSPGVPSP